MFDFKPLKERHFSLLARWFKEPHVAKWWPEESNLELSSLAKKYLNKIQSDWQSAFIAYLNYQPIGYIQCYHAYQDDKNRSKNEPKGTWGIDLFIGEPNYVGKGYGTQMVKNFVDMFFKKPEVKRIITDPHQSNITAIRCYEKVGFKKFGTIEKLNDTFVLMEVIQK